jgi:uncharacterized membrane protein YkoI
MNFARSFPPLLLVAGLGITGCEHVGEFEPYREVACLEAARISLKQAIAAAEAAENGRVLDADYRQDEEMGCLRDNPGAYDVTLLAGGKISVVSVDARSGQVGPRQEEGVMNALLAGGRFEGSPADMARIVPRLSMTAVQAIDAAEQQGGSAMVTWIEERNGKPGYTVKLVQRGRVRVTWIEAG